MTNHDDEHQPSAGKPDFVEGAKFTPAGPDDQPGVAGGLRLEGRPGGRVFEIVFIKRGYFFAPDGRLVPSEEAERLRRS